MMLGVAAAMAAPLIGLVGADGFGVHFFQQSSAGKTTTANIASSLYGNPDMALIKAKYTKDGGAMRKALMELVKHAQAISGKYLGNYVGKNVTQAVEVLAAYVLEDYSRTADTPGAKCQCGGRCEVRDLKESKRQGRPVMKPGSRCKGTGLKAIMHTRVHHALLRFVSVSQPTYSRRWKPFYDELASWCYQQESAAERCYNDMTGLRVVANRGNIEQS